LKKTNILQSSAAKTLKCGAIIGPNNHFVLYFLLNVLVEKFWKSANIRWSYYRPNL